MATVAGHTFQDGPNGRRCVAPKTVDGVTFICNVAWLDIKDATAWDIENKTPGVAHVNYLNHPELEQIQKEAAERQKAAWEAVEGIAKARG